MCKCKVKILIYECDHVGDCSALTQSQQLVHANQLRQSLFYPCLNIGRVNLHKCSRLAHVTLKSHVLSDENQKPILFVVSLTITLNALQTQEIQC